MGKNPGQAMHMTITITMRKHALTSSHNQRKHDILAVWQIYYKEVGGQQDLSIVYNYVWHAIININNVKAIFNFHIIVGVFCVSCYGSMKASTNFILRKNPIQK